MSLLSGKKRVIITGISPQVDGGKYPAKVTAGKPMSIKASVFCDGHDEVKAAVVLAAPGGAPGSNHGQEHPMNLLVNDCWEYTTTFAAPGMVEFKILGWVDHFATWQKGLAKKLAAGQRSWVDLEIGAGLMLTSDILTDAEKEALSGLVQNISPNNTDSKAQESLYMFIEEHAFKMARYRNEELVVETPCTYLLEVSRSKAAFSTWYELFPRSAAAQPGMHGTFKDVTRLLPRIASMGFDVLYFPPIHPIGEKKRKGKNNSLAAGEDDQGSPWAIGSRLGGHKAINPELGTLEDFTVLIASAHKAGIEVALDIAFQCAPDHPYVREHPAWFQWRPDGTVQYAENPPKKYEDILPFNFESDDWQRLWTELRSVLLYWVDWGVEIFRIDNPHTKSFRFWEWVIVEVKSKNPNVIFLAEAFTRPRLMEQLAKGGFDQSYTYFTWRTGKVELETYLRELTETPMKHYFRPNFWPNTPDILPPYLTEGGENAHIGRLILAATLSSNYGIYGPVYELGINAPVAGKEEYIDNEKYEVKHWNWDAYTRTREIITRVNRIRKANPALHETNNVHFAVSTSEHIICYVKSTPPSEAGRGNVLIIAVNLDHFNTQSAWVQIPLLEAGLEVGRTYQVHDLLGGSTYRWTGEWNYVSLNPYQIPAHIFLVEQ